MVKRRAKRIYEVKDEKKTKKVDDFPITVLFDKEKNQVFDSANNTAIPVKPIEIESKEAIRLHKRNQYLKMGFFLLFCGFICFVCAAGMQNRQIFQLKQRVFDLNKTIEIENNKSYESGKEVAKSCFEYLKKNGMTDEEFLRFMEKDKKKRPEKR